MKNALSRQWMGRGNAFLLRRRLVRCPEVLVRDKEPFDGGGALILQERARGLSGGSVAKFFLDGSKLLKSQR